MAPTKPERWPIFICYRRVDGSLSARRLHDILHKWQTNGADGKPIELDVYLDETMPGIADWKAIHGPYLERARAILVVCTPGAKINEGPDDWVHKEIDWWLAQRPSAPILVDPFKEGIRYVPLQIAQRWPDIQRIPLPEDEWSGLSGAALEQKTAAIRRQVLGAILPSGAEIYAKELADERARAQRLADALATAEALLLDTRAASRFSESRLIDTRRELEMSTRADILDRLASAMDVGTREANLRHELQQLDAACVELKAAGTDALLRGREYLEQADRAWEALLVGEPHGVERLRPEPPSILSIELINAGHGESVLVHYGTPDDTRVIMINAGPARRYKPLIEPRLRQLSAARYEGRPVPIELFVVGDRDEDKTGGLERMLSSLADTKSGDRVVELRGIWANIFRVDNSRGNLRAHIRRLIDDLRIPLNKPFDRHVIRPPNGRVEVTLPGGVELLVLGPDERRLRRLYDLSAEETRQGRGTIEPLLPETFSGATIATDPAPLRIPTQNGAVRTRCRPSTNARRLAGGAYRDGSVGNNASTVLLFRFRNRTFLHTGDSRGDYVLDGLSASNVLDDQGVATVDLMTVPHLGSDKNVTVDFFRRVRAAGYLFSGDGRHGNPAIATIASLVTARGCDAYRMYFVNRDGDERLTELVPTGDSRTRGRSRMLERRPAETLGAKLDGFFKNEQRFNPNYRRVFRSSSSGSVIIDLLDPVRY